MLWWFFFWLHDYGLKYIARQIIPISGCAVLWCDSLSLPNVKFQFCEGLLLGHEAALNNTSRKPDVSSPNETVTGFLYDGLAKMVLEPETCFVGLCLLSLAFRSSQKYSIWEGSEKWVSTHLLGIDENKGKWYLKRRLRPALWHEWVHPANVQSWRLRVELLFEMVGCCILSSGALFDFAGLICPSIAVPWWLKGHWDPRGEGMQFRDPGRTEFETWASKCHASGIWGLRRMVPKFLAPVNVGVRKPGQDLKLQNCRMRILAKPLIYFKSNRHLKNWSWIVSERMEEENYACVSGTGLGAVPAWLLSVFTAWWEHWDWVT